MGCGYSFLKLFYRRRLNRYKNRDENAPVFPRRITEDVFDYLYIPEPSQLGPYRGQIESRTSYATEIFNMIHRQEVKRILGISPLKQSILDNHLEKIEKLKSDPRSPRPKRIRFLENKLDYKPPVPEPIVEVHKTTKYVVPIHSDTSHSESYISASNEDICRSQPVEIPGGFRDRGDNGDEKTEVLNFSDPSIPFDSYSSDLDFFE